LTVTVAEKGRNSLTIVIVINRYIKGTGN